MEQKYKSDMPGATVEERFAWWEQKFGRLLSEQERAVLTLRFVDGLDLDQTAQRLGLTRQETRRIETGVILAGVHRRPVRTKNIREFYE